MPLSIKHPEADELARAVASETGESITEAVITALRERLARLRDRQSKRRLRDDIARIQSRYRRLPLRDRRSPEQILGYDERGLPK
jgi:antitoxin VapB